jgi:DNA-binding MarR family transcriptional regulator
MEIVRDRSNFVKGQFEDELHPGLDNVLFRVWLVSRATTEMLDSALRPSGLDADEFAVYSLLMSADAVTPSFLARWMAAPATSVSSYVKRMEGRGHVERVANPEDRRSYGLRLTDAGRQAHNDAGALFLPALEALRKALGPDEPKVQRALKSVRRSVDHVRLSAENRAHGA